MDIRIIEQPNYDLQIIIQCRKIDEKILSLKKYIELFDQKLIAKKDNRQYIINISDILYFETVDNYTFLYTKDEVLEVRLRLYELEYLLPNQDFIRISKSLIVNINKINCLKPELNRTILLTMCNGEHLHISRHYVPAFKKLLSI